MFLFRPAFWPTSSWIGEISTLPLEASFYLKSFSGPLSKNPWDGCSSNGNGGESWVSAKETTSNVTRSSQNPVKPVLNRFIRSAGGTWSRIPVWDVRRCCSSSSGPSSASPTPVSASPFPVRTFPTISSSSLFRELARQVWVWSSLRFSGTVWEEGRFS